MSSSTTVPTETASLAPPWHTAALIGLTVAVAVTGTVLSIHGAGVAPPSIARGSRITAIYLPMLVVQAALLVYVCRVGRSRNALPSLLGKPWSNVPGALGDVALAVAGFVIIEAVEGLALQLSGVAPSPVLAQILPDSSVERAAWIVVAASVGFCEEVVYRGYLQSQLTTFTGRPFLGIAMQGMLFGMAHGEQGLMPALRLAGYGIGLGVLAAFRRSLIPGILCHVGIDLAACFLRGR